MTLPTLPAGTVPTITAHVFVPLDTLDLPPMPPEHPAPHRRGRPDYGSLFAPDRLHVDAVFTDGEWRCVHAKAMGLKLKADGTPSTVSTYLYVRGFAVESDDNRATLEPYVQAALDALLVPGVAA